MNRFAFAPHEAAWHDAAAERLAVVVRWPLRCNEFGEREALAMVKRFTGGEPMWLTRCRVVRALDMTGRAIARGHQR